MPYTTEWVNPEDFLEHRGVTVYRTYKYDDVQQGPRTYIFTLSPHCGEDSCECEGRCMNVFDVRELLTWNEPPHPPYLTGENNTPENKKAWDRWHEERVEENHIRAAIQEAIDRGLLPKTEPGDEQRRGPRPPTPSR